MCSTHLGSMDRTCSPESCTHSISSVAVFESSIRDKSTSAVAYRGRYTLLKNVWRTRNRKNLTCLLHVRLDKPESPHAISVANCSPCIHSISSVAVTLRNDQLEVLHPSWKRQPAWRIARHVLIRSPRSLSRCATINLKRSLN